MKIKLIIAIFFISIIMLMILSSCEGIFNSDDEPKLPPITTSAAETFGCKIDGKVFLPDYKSFMSNQALFATNFSSQIEVSAKNNQKWESRGTSCNSSYVKLLFYEDGKGNIKDTAYIGFYKCIEKNEAGENTMNYTGTIIKNSEKENYYEILQFDTVSEHTIILSCKFSAIVKNDEGETKKITEGRFDVNLK
jgi:hypothetical protein